MEAFSYADGECPAGYKCARCGASGCKLWRQYQTLSNQISLLCISCAEKDQKDKCEIESGGGDQIGFLVAAVPTEDGKTFWGYTSIPVDGCDWWDDLPMKPGGKPPVDELSPSMRRRFRHLREALEIANLHIEELRDALLALMRMGMQAQPRDEEEQERVVAKVAKALKSR